MNGAESEDFMKKKIFRCNDDGVAEWCVAEDKEQAYKFLSDLWGAETMKECEEYYFDNNPQATLDEFIEDFFEEEPDEKEFMINDAGEGDTPIIKKISEWLKDIDAVPSYFCHEDY
jgi:hypothetical protein